MRRQNWAQESPIKAAAYTSGANLITMVLLILPYFLFTNPFAIANLPDRPLYDPVKIPVKPYNKELHHFWPG